ncbi:hypothetical protein Tco_0138905 [Tanacetum coccineum]
MEHCETEFQMVDACCNCFGSLLLPLEQSAAVPEDKQTIPVPYFTVQFAGHNDLLTRSVVTPFIRLPFDTINHYPAEPLSTDSIWSEIEQQKIVSWRYYDTSRVHCLNLESMDVYLLSDRKYPLPAESKRLAGKELSNPLIADDLLKIIWLSMYHGLTNLNIDYQDWSAMKTSCCQDLKT